jgi:hypothetical protein
MSEAVEFDTASTSSSLLNTDEESLAESDADAVTEASRRRHAAMLDSRVLSGEQNASSSASSASSSSAYSSYSSSSESSVDDAAQREPAGYAHNEAIVKLTAGLESAIQQAHWSASRSVRQFSSAGWRGLTTLGALAALIVAAALRSGGSPFLSWIELLLMCVCAVFEALLGWRRRQRQRLFLCERAARHVAALRRSSGKQHAAFSGGNATQRTPSLVLVSCKRGGTWSALPVQLLVDGDAIALEANECAPCACHAFGPLVCRLKAGEANPVTSRTFYIVDETPAARQFGSTVAAVTARRPSRVALVWRMLAWRVFQIGGVLTALALVAGIVRCVVSHHCDAYTIGELIFSRPAAVWIAAIGFGNQLLQLIVYGVVNAQLATLLDVLERTALDKAIERMHSLNKAHGDRGDNSNATDDAANNTISSNNSNSSSNNNSNETSNVAEATSKRSSVASDSDSAESSDNDTGGAGNNGGGANGPTAAAGDDDSDADPAAEHADLLAVKHVALPLRDLWRSFLTVASSRHELVGPYDPASFALGSASALLVIDKAGVMADPVARPVRVLLPQYVRRRKASDTEAAPAAAGDRIADFGVALSLHRPSTTARHTHFEQSELVKHMASLKPIGLNVLLERPCRLPPHVQHRLPPRHLQSALHLHDQCLCALGREIGFTDAATAPFAPLRVVYANFATHGHQHHHHHHRHGTNMQSSATEPLPTAAAAAAAATTTASAAPPQALHERYHYRLLALPGDYGRSPPAMHALVVQQSPSGALQLLSRGNAVSVIDHCSHRFDGNSLRLLTQAERRALLVIDAAWRRQGKGSLALAYKPIPHTFYSLLQSDAPAPVGADDGDGEGTGAPSATTMASLVGGQVLIGMVSVSLVPRLSPTFVQALRSGGVRFKYMSPDSTRTTVAFAGKLGLETEWSFVISLKEPSGSDGKDDGDDDDFAARFASQVDQLSVKPPSGVTEVRQYIEQTQDDMPLRVSVHTNCTKKAIADMIRLMQDQGEVVCVMGASVCAASTETYRIADFAFSVPPARPDCLDDWSAPPAWLARERRHELQHRQPLSIVALLASLPCALIGRSVATDHDVLLALHLHARATMQAAHRTSVFYAFATGTVVLLLGVGHLLSWMAPLDVWHVFAIAFGATLPLSVGQLLNAADSSLARRLPGKYAIPREQAGKLTHALMIIVLPTLLQLLFVFVASLYSLFRAEERAAWGASDVGNLWLGVRSVAAETRTVAPLDDQLTQQLALARHVTWLALVLDLFVAALLVNLAGRRRVARPSPLWLPIAAGVLLPPILVVALHADAPLIEWYVWFVLLVWPTLALFPLALLARRQYWYWYEKFQAFLEMEFNTVLPAWSPVVQNKEQADQVATYSGHGQRGDDW